jgi:hypothetical protein
MVFKVNGATSSTQTLTGSVGFYKVYCKSPLCFSDPDPNPPENERLDRAINIQVTKSIKDQSQKNFEIIVMAIGLRAVPDIISDPIAISDLSSVTTAISGEGFIWKFAVSRKNIFGSDQNPVEILVNELDGIILNSGVAIDTKTQNKNMVFEMEKY